MSALASLPIFVTNHAAERAAERVGVAQAAAPRRVEADVREALAVYRRLQRAEEKAAAPKRWRTERRRSERPLPFLKRDEDAAA